MHKLLRLFLQQGILILLAANSTACQTTTLPAAAAVPPSTQEANFSLADKNYRQLLQALPVYQNAAAHPWAVLSAQVPLKLGVKNLAVVALRARLKATNELQLNEHPGLDVYDAALGNAVKTFQACHGLKPDGIIGKDTLYALNRPAAELLTQIQVNLARWAKLAGELGNRYILVNVPAYRLEVVENGRIILSMKAIVGKPTRPTPDIQSTVTRVIFNPYWNVPQLIAQKDIVPKIINNPAYLHDMQIKIINREEDNATEVSPEDIDWQAAQAEGFQYHFRQDPGSQNALGQVKFEFQNSHDVYMHDTPAKSLFAADKRDFSSGCIRLEKPFALVAYLMQADPAWDNDRLETILAAGKTRFVKVPTPTPVIITYITTWVDEKGQLQFRDDIYGRDIL
jgi:murein L,D-transpeptidase YcbB/YkuD